jgi:hypothetical protein
LRDCRVRDSCRVGFDRRIQSVERLRQTEVENLEATVRTQLDVGRSL